MRYRFARPRRYIQGQILSLSWARYDLAKRGMIRLMPPDRNVAKLHEDYEHMQNMIFGELPNFDAILKSISNLENEINIRGSV